MEAHHTSSIHPGEPLFHPKKARHKSLWASLAVTINLIMGTGFLALPSVFSGAGVLLSVLLLLFFSAVMDVTCHLELEIMCRAEALCAHCRTSSRPRGGHHPPLAVGDRDGHDEDALGNMLLEMAHEEDGVALELGSRTFQMTELCQLFGGTGLQVAYSVFLALYLFGASWTYATIWASALATTVPLTFFLGPVNGRLCDPSAPGFPGSGSCSLLPVYLVVYAAIVVPLSVMGVKEQSCFQALLAVVRLVMGLAMCLTASASLLTPLFGQQPPWNGDAPLLADLSGLPTAAPTILYSLLLSSGVSIITESLRHRSGGARRQDVSWCITTALAFTAVLYLLITIPTVLLFGKGVASSCNLEWSSFFQQKGSSRPLWASALSYGVVLFPALDVLSIAPLNNLIIADNLLAAVAPHSHHHQERSEPHHPQALRRSAFRFCCSVPPILCAWGLPSLAKGVTWTGAVAVVISCIIPPYLYHLSYRRLQRELHHHNDSKTSRWRSHLAWGLVPLGVAVAALVALPPILHL